MRFKSNGCKPSGAQPAQAGEDIYMSYMDLQKTLLLKQKTTAGPLSLWLEASLFKYHPCSHVVTTPYLLRHVLVTMGDPVALIYTERKFLVGTMTVIRSGSNTSMTSLPIAFATLIA